MSLAVTRIAGQVVPGVEVARAWSAASAWNSGGLARTWLPPCGGSERDARERRWREGRKPLPGWQSDRLVVALILLTEWDVGRPFKQMRSTRQDSSRQGAACPLLHPGPVSSAVRPAAHSAVRRRFYRRRRRGRAVRQGRLGRPPAWPPARRRAHRRCRPGRVTPRSRRSTQVWLVADG
jgi:hypothetical protein